MALELALLTDGVEQTGPRRAKPLDLAPRPPNRTKPLEAEPTTAVRARDARPIPPFCGGIGG